MTYMEYVNYEWDEGKRKANILKHGIDFVEVVILFEDDLTVIIEDPEHYEEQRFIALGVDSKERIVVVVHVYIDDGIIRIISARKADKKERNQYKRWT